MINNYFTIIRRYLVKNKQHVFINIAGLSIAIACCVLAYLNFTFSENFDGQHTKIREVYRLNMESTRTGLTGKFGIAPLALYDVTKSNIPDVDGITRYMREGVYIKSNDDLFSISLTMTDPDFFEMLDFKPLYGDPTGIKDFATLNLTEETALKVFGRTDVVGEDVELVVNDEVMMFKVGSVLENTPLNGSFTFDASSNIEAYLNYKKVNGKDNWDDPLMMFLHIKDPTKVAKVFDVLTTYAKQNIEEEGVTLKAYPEVLYGLADRSRIERVKHHWLNSGMPKKAVTIPLIMAVVILIIACINFTNTTIAISSQRLKEIGIRKVMGGVKSQLIIQFMIEGIVLCAISLIFGLLLAELLVPYYSGMWNWIDLKIQYSQNISFLLFLVTLVFGTAIVASLYPAFYLSNFNPSKILKGTAVLKDSSWVTRGLLAVQFFFSIIIGVVAVGFWQNGDFQTHKSLGFNPNGVFYHYLRDGHEVEMVKKEMAKYPFVKGMEGATNNIHDIYYERRYSNHEALFTVEEMITDAGYLDFMEIKLLDGRDFKKHSETDVSSSILVNQALVDEMGWENPFNETLIGYDSVEYHVIGIVDNFLVNGFWNKVSPLVIRCSDEKNFKEIMIKTNPEDMEQAENKLGEIYSSLFPNRLYNPGEMDEEIARANKTNANVLKVFGFLGIVSFLLTGTALYSLITLRISSKTKELGIRKVLGASAYHIILKITMAFTLIIGGSALIGFPLGKKVSDLLLGTLYYYHSNISMGLLLLFLITILVMVGVVISGKIWGVLRRNPVESLRSE